ncbi:MAG TPA: helix-turn-helix transcriptional regulator [Candidatus Acidoferrales bacterium]|nr:helix-turn-helix transcriptional regulator [Candidatus Acidoferrales bacterium]
MESRERATLVANDELAEDQPGNQRVRLPDDPKLRVELAPGFRQELADEKRVSIAAAVESPRAKEPRQRLDPSSVSRYARGRVAPTVRTARRLASALRTPLDEAVVGFSRGYARPTVAWLKQVLYTRRYRTQVMQVLEAFEIVLRHVHFGFVSDTERPERHLTRPEADCAAYRVMELTFEQPLSALIGTDVILAYRLLNRPPVFIDYGDVHIQPERVVAHEFWTHRADAAPLASGARTVRIKTWIDGRAVDFLVRSARRFTVSRMCEADELAVGDGPLVTFRPSGIHRHAPAEL